MVENKFKNMWYAKQKQPRGCWKMAELSKVETQCLSYKSGHGKPIMSIYKH